MQQINGGLLPHAVNEGLKEVAPRLLANGSRYNACYTIRLPNTHTWLIFEAPAISGGEAELYAITIEGCPAHEIEMPQDSPVGVMACHRVALAQVLRVR